MSAERCKNDNARDNDAPKNARGENGAKGIGAPESSESEVKGEEESEEIEWFLPIYIIYGGEEVPEREKSKEKEPDERERKFVVGTGGGSDGNERIVRAEKDNREGIEKEEAKFG